MVAKEKPVAVFAPSIRNIKLYADGRIDYQGKSGSVIGATARVEKSGEKGRIRDTREVVLRIDGPSVSIAAPLPAAALTVHERAEEFVAKINEISNGVDGSTPAPASAPTPAPALQPAPARPDMVDRAIPPDTSVPSPAGDHEATLQSMDLLIGSLERLGKLRDSGVLTEDEFQAQKTALLRAAHKS
jgi:hypothetical protein